MTDMDSWEELVEQEREGKPGDIIPRPDTAFTTVMSVLSSSILLAGLTVPINKYR